MTDETNEFALDPMQPAETAQADAGPVLMVRDPKSGGKGVVKMLVPAEQIADFKAAGWTKA